MDDEVQTVNEVKKSNRKTTLLGNKNKLIAKDWNGYHKKIK